MKEITKTSSEVKTNIYIYTKIVQVKQSVSNLEFYAQSTIAVISG